METTREEREPAPMPPGAGPEASAADLAAGSGEPAGAAPEPRAQRGLRAITLKTWRQWCLGSQ
jgi:hypothetical protein